MSHFNTHTSCILAQPLVLPITITVLYSVQYITTITYDLSRVVPLIRQLTPKIEKSWDFQGCGAQNCAVLYAQTIAQLFLAWFLSEVSSIQQIVVAWIIGNIWPDSVVPSSVTHHNRPVSLITGDNYWKLYQDVYLDWFVFRVFDDATVTTLEDQSLDALSTAAPSRSDAFGDCFQAIQEYSNYVELFLIKENECFIAEDVTFM